MYAKLYPSEIKPDFAEACNLMDLQLQLITKLSELCPERVVCVYNKYASQGAAIYHFDFPLRDTQLIFIGFYHAKASGEAIPIDTKIIYSIDKETQNLTDHEWDEIGTFAFISTDPCYVFTMPSGEIILIDSNKTYTKISQKIYNLLTTKKGAPTTMNFGFDIGPVDPSIATMSVCGIAVIGDEGRAFAYRDGKVIDVTGMTFNVPHMIYRFPVAPAAIKPGDLILHNGKPVYVNDIQEGYLDVIDIASSESKTILPVTNVFGFNYVTKIAPLFSLPTAKPSADKPFGDLSPFFMADLMSSSKSSNMDLGTIMAYNCMMGGKF